MTVTGKFQGADGLIPKRPVGVVATVGLRGVSGAPTAREYFFLMTPGSARREYEARSGKRWSAPARSPHPLFAAWNAAAKSGNPMCSTLYGRLVHASVGDSARWERLAWKTPEKGGANPLSGQPWCRGNGRAAKRFAAVVDGKEVYNEIVCPGQLCPYAMAPDGGGRPACQVESHLVFELAWLPGPFAGLPSMICELGTRSERSLESLLGALEQVAGTRALGLYEDGERDPVAGQLVEMGVADGSLFGLPLSIAIEQRSSRTRAEKYPLLRFSPLDVRGWIGWRRQLAEDVRLLSGAVAPVVAALPAAPAVSVQDPEFEADLGEYRLDVASPAEVAAEAVEVVEDAEVVDDQRRLTEDQLFEVLRRLAEIGASPEDVARDLGVSRLDQVVIRPGEDAGQVANRIVAGAAMRALAERGRR